ncbi:chaperonin 10-like protein [Lasiosphaeris hirsuta]|uniref:Chaperonin 10-like protein n=1 Tax=Lasiosphaeris hirsuta TaxID=260670 RepID=A0AA40BD08_9PEZI|nr:chaperonin 10-like protein [Lasiosphaeris hirsuta]
MGAVPHDVTQNDHYNGCLIPKDAGVVNNRHADPRRFEPERYEDDFQSLGDAAANPHASKRDQFTFGAGRRICPGIHVAERGLFLGVSRMLWGFNMTPAQDADGKDIIPDQEKLTQEFVCMPEEFPATITPRREKKRQMIVDDWKAAEESLDLSRSTIQPDEVLVEISASGLCHTDLSCANGTLPCAPNAVLGHEGTVLVVGAAVTTVAAGDLVLLSFSHCETCRKCAAGHPANYYTFNERNFGGARPSDGSAAMCAGAAPGGAPLHSSFFGQSSFARHTLAHRSSVVRVPPGTDLALFAPLGCGVQTGAGAVLNTLGVKEGSAVAVFGVGSVGMAAVMVAGLARLDLAIELGATHGVIGCDADVVEQIRRSCPLNGVDYAVDCTGVPPRSSGLRTMIDALRSRGRAATVGAPWPGHCVSLDIMGQLTFGKEYVECTERDSLPAEFIPHLIEMHAKGLFPLESLIEYYDVADFVKAIEDTKSGKLIKPVLKWDFIQ